MLTTTTNADVDAADGWDGDDEVMRMENES